MSRWLRLWSRAGRARPRGVAHHEAFLDEPTSLPSDRAFVFVLAAVLTVIGLTPVLRGGPIRRWAVVLAALLLLVGWLRPRWAHWLKEAWMVGGAAVGQLVTTLALAVIFFAVVTPLAWLRRWRGDDPLRLGFAPRASTYWIPRQPPGPAPETLTNQF